MSWSAVIRDTGPTACHDVNVVPGADRPERAQSYDERRPVSALAGLVSSTWIQSVSADSVPHSSRSVPNGSAEFRCRVGSIPQVIGPLTAPRAEVLKPGTVIVGVRFFPGAAAAVLGVPASELVDTALDAEELWGRSAVALGEAVASAPSPQAALAVLEHQIVARLADAPAPDPLVMVAVRELMPWRVGDVGALTSSLSISERQLRRRSRAAVGLAPKPLHRMLRFQGFLALTQLAISLGRKPAADGLARLAAEAGYADQAHLTRECVRLTGLTPRAFLGETERHCGCGHDHSASFVPLLRSRAAV
jgi:AraC-like DNA-binding protein